MLQSQKILSEKNKINFVTDEFKIIEKENENFILKKKNLSVLQTY